MTDVLADRYGFGPAFAAEWHRQWGSELAELLEAEDGSPDALWGDFALSANMRGREMALDVAIQLSSGLPSLAGRRALDLGCGIGGTAVALAELGAETWGIDLDPDRVALAHANAVDHGVDVRFSHDDALDPEVPIRMGPFDAIVAEDVLEHVADARLATRALAGLLAGGGVARVTIPNGDAVPFVRADGHYLLPGLTLLRDRELAAAYFDASFEWGEYDVGNYHSFDDYHDWFTEAGLEVAEIDAVDAIAWADVDAELAAAAEEVRVAAGDASLPAAVRSGLLAGWEDYTGRVAAARDGGRDHAAMRIATRFWRFYVTQGPVDRRWSVRRPPRWAWRSALKRVPGLVPLVRRLRR